MFIRKIILLIPLVLFFNQAFAASFSKVALDPKKDIRIEFAISPTKKNLKIDNGAGQITIHGDDKAVKATAVISTSDDGVELLYSNGPSDLVIKVLGANSTTTTTRTFGGGVSTVTTSDASNDVSIHLTVPTQFLNDVKIDTGSSEIYLDSIKGAGRFKIDSGSGSSTFSHVSARSFKVDTGSGDIYFLNSAGSAKVDSGSGDAQFTDFTGKMSLDSGSGAFNVQNTTGDMNVKTESGSVQVDVNSGENIQIITKKGSVQVNGQTGGNIVIQNEKGRVTTNNPNALSQKIYAKQRLYKDLSGKWPEVQAIEQNSDGKSDGQNVRDRSSVTIISGGDTVISNEGVVTGEEAARVQAQIAAAMAAGLGSWHLGS